MLRKLLVGAGAIAACSLVMPAVADETSPTTVMQPAMHNTGHPGAANRMERREEFRKEHEEMMRKKREEWREHRREEMQRHHEEMKAEHQQWREEHHEMSHQPQQGMTGQHPTPAPASTPATTTTPQQ